MPQCFKLWDKRPRIFPLGLFLPCLICFSTLSFAQDETTHGACSPIVMGAGGNVTINNNCPLTLTDVQLLDLQKATSSGVQGAVDKALSNQGLLVDSLEKLSSNLGVHKSALNNFFKILDKKKVNPGDLDQELRWIAKQHLQLTERVKRHAQSQADDPAIQAILLAANRAIKAGDYKRADAKLAEAEAQDIALITRKRKEVDTNKLRAAKTRAERGELALLSFDYNKAGEQFANAANIVPADRPLAIAVYANQAGTAFQDGGSYAKAEPLYKRALAIGEETLGPNHPDTATYLNNLALLYETTRRYTEAEPLFKRALAIDEEKHGLNHPNVAIWLNNLALLYETTGRYAEAEPLYKRALAIGEETLGPNHPNVATSLNNLAALYETTGRYAEAEPLYKRALVIGEKTLRPNHPSVTTWLNNLAGLYRITGRYAEAEPLYKRALAIGEKTLGPNHPDVAIRLNNLAALYQTTGRFAEAEPLYKRALVIGEKTLGPNVATWLNNLAGLYRTTDRSAEAEPLYKRALAIGEKTLGPNHPNVAIRLNNLAGLYETTDRSAEAEPLYKRALDIFTVSLGANHPNTKTIRGNLHALRSRMEK